MLFHDLCGVFVYLKHVAVLDQNDIFVRISLDVVFDKFLLPEQHSIFAVDRHDVFWPRSFDHYLYVLLRSVARDVNQTTLFLDNVRTAFVEVTDKAADRLVIAGYYACRQHNGIAFFDLHALVGRCGHVPKRRPRLTLRTRHEINDLIVIERTRFAKFDQRAIWYL